MTHLRSLCVLASTLFIAGCLSLQPDEPPSAPQISLQPDAPAPGDSLELIVTAGSIDPEGQPVTYDITWTRDDEPAPEFADLRTIPGDQVQSERTWSVTVTPSDGALEGAPASASVTVAAPPLPPAEPRLEPPPSTEDATPPQPLCRGCVAPEPMPMVRPEPAPRPRTGRPSVSKKGSAATAVRNTKTIKVEAGPIWNQQHASERCPTVCAAAHGTWTTGRLDQWYTTVPNEMSVCLCQVDQ